MSDIQNSFVNTVKMKETEKEQKQTNRRQTFFLELIDTRHIQFYDNFSHFLKFIAFRN